MTMVENLWGTVKSLGMWVNASRSERPYIFITGAPRSGTTLIKTVLTVHPAIGGGDYESTGLFKIRNLYGYTCGEMENGWIHVDCADAQDIIDFYERLTDALLDHHGGRIFVDKIWPNSLRLGFVTSKFPRARWIHMVRDGRDSYCSAQSHPHIPQSSDLERFARYWTNCNRMIERYVAEEHRITVRYEDLASNPDEKIPRIMQFLGLEVEEGQYHPAEAGPLPSIQERSYHKRLADPLDTRSVGRSKTEMTEEEHDRFTEIAEADLYKYGYMR